MVHNLKVVMKNIFSIKFYFHLVAQADTLVRSLFNKAAVWSIFPDESREQSSANINITLSSPSVMSMMYIKNNRGYSLLP